MGPPNRTMYPTTLGSTLDEIDRRLRALETAPSLNNSSIKDGALKILDAASARRAQLGKQPDGSYGIGVFDADGNTIRLSLGQLLAYTDPNGILSAAGYGARA